ncbi:MAG: hypothetical protein AB7R89_07420 [Dehalococcoidia bacterium]
MVGLINRFFTAIGGVFRIFVRRVEGTGDMQERIRNVQEREYERFKKMYELAAQSGQGPYWAVVRQKNAHANVTALEQSMRIHLEAAKQAQTENDLARAQFEEDEARKIAPQLAQARGELQAADQLVADITRRSDELNQQVRSYQEEMERQWAEDQMLESQMYANQAMLELTKIEEQILGISEHKDEGRSGIRREAQELEAEVYSRTRLIDTMKIGRRSAQQAKLANMNAQGKLEFEKLQQELGYTPVQVQLQREQATRATSPAAQPATAANQQAAGEADPPAAQSGTRE